MTDEKSNVGGGGAFVSDLFKDPKYTGRDARLVSRAITEGWLSPWAIPPDKRLAIKQLLDDAMTMARQDGDARAIAAGVETYRKMAADDAKALETLVKLLRLVDGQSTENIDHDVRTRIIVERREPGSTGDPGG